MNYKKANRTLAKFGLVINSLCLIQFGYYAWYEHNKGYLTACAWIVIAMLYNYRDLNQCDE